MIKAMKVKLRPNNRQRTKLFACAGTARFVYNWALGRQQANHDIGQPFMNDAALRRELTGLKRTDPKFAWLNGYSNNIAKQAVKDACGAYQKFFKGLAEHPRFKSRKRSKPGFYADPCKLQFTDTHVKLEKLTASRKTNRQKFNFIRLAEFGRIPVDGKYVNPRITFDGLDWWISVGIECDDEAIKPSAEPGIGIKDLAICSDGSVYRNINKTAEVRRLKKKRRRLQRKISRKYLKNKKGDSYCKTRNIIKSEKQLLKINHRLTNIRHNYLH